MRQKTYSLFCKERGRWTRLTPLAFKLDAARRAFQTALLAATARGLNAALRPAEDDMDNIGTYEENMERLLGRTD